MIQVAMRFRPLTGDKFQHRQDAEWAQANCFRPLTGDKFQLSPPFRCWTL